jgi:hypothetical protein
MLRVDGDEVGFGGGRVEDECQDKHGAGAGTNGYEDARKILELMAISFFATPKGITYITLYIIVNLQNE